MARTVASITSLPAAPTVACLQTGHMHSVKHTLSFNQWTHLDSLWSTARLSAVCYAAPATTTTTTAATADDMSPRPPHVSRADFITRSAAGASACCAAAAVDLVVSYDGRHGCNRNGLVPNRHRHAGSWLPKARWCLRRSANQHLSRKCSADRAKCRGMWPAVPGRWAACASSAATWPSCAVVLD